MRTIPLVVALFLVVWIPPGTGQSPPPLAPGTGDQDQDPASPPQSRPSVPPIQLPPGAVGVARYPAICWPEEVFDAQAENDFKEFPIAAGISEIPDRLVVIYSRNDLSTWTLAIRYGEADVVCVVEAGTDLRINYPPREEKGATR